jgi:ornithine cyclodeaminase/alanine dehydrogenase-like protein (mu-crystallin family)
MATVVSGAAVYLLDESDNRNLWIIGSGVMASIFPWTMIVMIHQRAFQKP